MRKSHEHEPTYSYYYLKIKLAKCMMRADTFNLHIYPVRTEITSTQYIPILQVFSSDQIESKGIITDENLSQVCSKD